jgi:hypothetical protein
MCRVPDINGETGCSCRGTTVSNSAGSVGARESTICRHFRVKPNLSNPFNLILPVQSRLEKFSTLPVRANHLYKPAPSRLTRGALAIVTNAGRDAVDAGSAFDESVASRTAKSCGPDAPTLASTRDNALHCAGMVTTSPVHQGEREGNR